MGVVQKVKEVLYSVIKPKLAKINQFENIHKGETCYLIAGGISIKHFDLGAFSDHVSLVMNHIPLHKQFSKLNTNYCFMIEPYWFLPMWKTKIDPKRYITNTMQKRYRQFIKQYPDKNFFINLSNLPVLSGKNITYLFNNIPNSKLADHFYERGINPFMGSARFSVFMAIYFGFKKAYLVGFDYTHYPSTIHHWFEKGKGEKGSHLYHEKEFFAIASEFIEIVTVTVEGGSQVLPYITYKELTGKDPVFRENTELVEKKDLDVLHAMRDYSIW